MSRAIRIAQVSDCHVSADLKQDYRGINPHQNLVSLVQDVRDFEPDLLLATGDLSEDGSPESYGLLKQYLHLPGVPVLALPGNHDDPRELAKAFPGSPEDGIAVTEHGPWRLIRLNSCLYDRPEGRLAEAALDELEAFLARAENRPCAIAVHHHPVPVGNPWIDKYPLENPARLLKLVDEYSGVKLVLWGHIHHAFSTERRGTAMLGGPSTAINSLKNVEKFTGDPAGPAFRWLELGSDHGFKNGVVTSRVNQIRAEPATK